MRLLSEKLENGLWTISSVMAELKAFELQNWILFDREHSNANSNVRPIVHVLHVVALLNSR